MQTLGGKEQTLGPLAARRYLETYFFDQLRCKFTLDGIPMRPHEIFDEEGLLYLFANMADERCRAIFDLPIVDEVTVSATSLTAYRVALSQDLGALQVMVLCQAAEEVFGVSPNKTEWAVEILPLIDYMMLPPEERSADKCPWKPLRLVN